MKEKIGRHIRTLWQSPQCYKLRGEFFYLGEKLMGYPQMKKKFKEKTGYDLDLKNPQSFNQKICWKKIHDRNPLLPVVADKYKVREYLIKILGMEEAEKLSIPLLYVTDNPETIPFDNLPDEYIIKANHGSGTNIIIEKNTPVDRQRIIMQCREWLSKPYGLFKHEWGYKNIQRRIIIEKLLRDEDGGLPKDFKFHMLNGTCLMIQINQGRFNDKKGRTLTLYNPDWSKIDVFWEYPPANQVKLPENFYAMRLLAETLSLPFDYVRVDLYSIEGKIYFGELTNYPTSGYALVKPTKFDFELGKKWQLTPEYWKKVNPRYVHN